MLTPVVYVGIISIEALISLVLVIGTLVLLHTFAPVYKFQFSVMIKRVFQTN